MSVLARFWRVLGAVSLGLTVASLLDLPLASSLSLFENHSVSMMVNSLYLLLELSRYR